LDKLDWVIRELFMELEDLQAAIDKLSSDIEKGVYHGSDEADEHLESFLAHVEKFKRNFQELKNVIAEG